jgi:hypothetical protein
MDRLLAIAASGFFASSATAAIVATPTVTNSFTAFSAGFAASNTVDGTQAEYASQGGGTNTFLEFTFAGPTNFNGIVVMNRDSGGMSDLIGNFTLTFDGGASFGVTRSALRGQSQLYSVGNQTATVVRLDVDTIGLGDAFNNTGAMEVIFVNRPTGLSLISGVSIFDSAAPFNAAYTALNAIDGDIGRNSGITGESDNPEYASASLGTNAFVDFDLGGVRMVGGFDFFDRIASVDHATAFDMIFSMDNVFGNGDDVLRSYSKTGIAIGDTFAPVSAQYVRYDVTGNANGGANTGLNELYFYAVPEPAGAALLGVATGILLLRRRRN